MCTRTVQDCQQRAFRLAFRITRNQEDAEDAQQEALLKAHRNLDQFQGRARFTTWISRIAINEALMCLRKRRNVVQVPLEDVFQEDERLRQFRVAFQHSGSRDRLFPKRAPQYAHPGDRRIFPRPPPRDLLRAVESLSVIDTAKALQVSVSTVKTRMPRARRELKETLLNASKPSAPAPDVQPEPQKLRRDLGDLSPVTP